MKYIYRFIVVLMLPLLMAGCKKDNQEVKPTIPVVTGPGSAAVYKAPADFRVVGYIYADDITGGAANGFNMERVNYLNIAFLNPGADGKFGDMSGLTAFIGSAHQHNVKVMASICGGDAPTYFDALLADGKRDALVSALMKLVTDNNFDGVDVDIEDVEIDKNYEPFVIALSTALKAKGKLITAAVGTYESSQLSDKALSNYDFLNVMSYDLTGPWDPSNPGPHSPYSMAVSDLDFWTNTRGIAKGKLNLGLPLYGYDFEASVVTSVDYVDIVNAHPGAENSDEVTTASGGTIYYNGMPTIAKKTQLAITNAGGVMLWELMADKTGPASLLNVVNKTANPDNK